MWYLLPVVLDGVASPSGVVLPSFMEYIRCMAYACLYSISLKRANFFAEGGRGCRLELYNKFVK